eukprot:3883540-Alexandrium_andersonii.AAC.1
MSSAPIGGRPSCALGWRKRDLIAWALPSPGRSRGARSSPSRKPRPSTASLRGPGATSTAK